MLNAIVTQLEEAKASESQASIGKQVRVMQDTGATHNFISVDEAKRLGLRITNDKGAIKAANAIRHSTCGEVKFSHLFEEQQAN
ncbi:hypothetical protein EZV62_026899 [Acer yangbiense]|uniref:Uncharacterized protein n=1 Tax=Acer yangbiense TaxID=1000413 RepID=A0A5C7GSP3_9ROSI|nr:hypothetical protein EZV62_026899 [Acer yangbiense]